MTIRDALVKAGKAIVGGVKYLFKKVFAADVNSVVKAGLFIGTSAVTLYLMAKALKTKTKVYQDDSNKSTLDRALELNYCDKHNRDKLDPLLKNVKKELSGKKSKNHKYSSKMNREKFRKAFENLDQRINSNNPDVIRGLQKFNREMEELERDDFGGFDDDQILRKAWAKA